MKSLANQARKEMVSTGKIPYSASAKAAYQNEVYSLNAKLNVALKNAPRERQAQVIANATVTAKKQANPDMTNAEISSLVAQGAVLIDSGASFTLRHRFLRFSTRNQSGGAFFILSVFDSSLILLFQRCDSTVNNKQPEGKKVLGNTPKDAIGINSKVAERLFPSSTLP